MLIKLSAGIPSSAITDNRLYMDRRTFLRSAAAAAFATTGSLLGTEALVQAAQPAPHGRKLEAVKASPYSRVAVDGECNKPAVYHIEDVFKGRTLEDRIYRRFDAAMSGSHFLMKSASGNPTHGMTIDHGFKHLKSIVKIRFVEDSR